MFPIASNRNLFYAKEFGAEKVGIRDTTNHTGRFRLTVILFMSHFFLFSRGISTTKYIAKQTRKKGKNNKSGMNFFFL
jgi:hypothetical protein